MTQDRAATDGKVGGGDKTPRAKRLLNVTVLMGGPSAERDVSLLSGAAVADGLERAGHIVTRAALDERDAGPRASRLGLDKAASKQLFKRAGLSTPDWMVIEQYHSPAQRAGWLAEIDLPVVLKPVDGGSSVDIIIAREPGQRDEFLEGLIDRYGRAMLERLVPGRELTVSILGDRALPVMEIVPAREFYDYTAKYADDAGTQYVFDHGLGDEVVASVSAAARAAHEAIGARDMSRVDFILDDDGVPQVLEINTIPGFTSHSLLPMAAEKVGVPFDGLVDRLVQMAADR